MSAPQNDRINWDEFIDMDLAASPRNSLPDSNAHDTSTPDVEVPAEIEIPDFDFELFPEDNNNFEGVDGPLFPSAPELANQESVGVQIPPPAGMPFQNQESAPVSYQQNTDPSAIWGNSGFHLTAQAAGAPLTDAGLSFQEPPFPSDSSSFGLSNQPTGLLPTTTGPLSQQLVTISSSFSTELSNGEMEEVLEIQPVTPISLPPSTRFAQFPRPFPSLPPSFPPTSISAYPHMQQTPAPDSSLLTPPTLLRPAPATDKAEVRQREKAARKQKRKNTKAGRQAKQSPRFDFVIDKASDGFQPSPFQATSFGKRARAKTSQPYSWEIEKASNGLLSVEEWTQLYNEDKLEIWFEQNNPEYKGTCRRHTNN
jgi:hypothetical protein